MRRWIVLSVCVATMAGCSSDDSTKDGKDKDAGAGGDAGAGSGDMDSGSDETGEPLVGMTGKSCEEASDCAGKDPVCITELDLGFMDAPMLPGAGGPELPTTVTFPGGYCSANCESSSDCNAGAGCAVKDLLGALEPFLQGQDLMGLDPSQVQAQCLTRCAKPADCRDGYTCETLLEALGVPIPFPLPGVTKFCLPIVEEPVDDAGPVLPPTDAGVTPTPDASTGDAGSDAG